MAQSLLMKFISVSSSVDIPSYPILAFTYDPDETDRHSLVRSCACVVVTHLNSSSLNYDNQYIYMNNSQGLQRILYMTAQASSGRSAAYFIFAFICIKNGSGFDVVGYNDSMKKFSFTDITYFTVSSNRDFYVIEIPLED